MQRPVASLRASDVGTVLLVDGHVHIHACYSRPRFFTAAAENFAATRQRLSLPENSLGCLLLTECAGVDVFAGLRSGAEPLASSGWRVELTEERCSVRLRHEEGENLIVVAGRQIITSERLEVLAWGLVETPPDGRPIRDVVPEVVKAGAIAVLPWALGKWWGGRGRTVQALVDAEPRLPFYLGDNGGRPCIRCQPRLLQRGEARGIRIVPGSDPLMLPRHERRAGTCGFVLDLEGDPIRPMMAIAGRLASMERSPRRFGKHSSLPFALYSQVALRFRRQRPPSAHTVNS